MVQCPKCGNRVDLPSGKGPDREAMPFHPWNVPAGEVLGSRGQPIRYVETIECYRTLRGQSADVINIEGFYHTGDGYDDGRNPRLQCLACNHEWQPDRELDFY